MAQKIEKSCLNADSFKLQLDYYPQARDAFGAILDSLDFKADQVLLLPGYIGWSANEGSGVFDPVRERGINAAFYHMHTDLSIDMDSAVEMINSLNVKAILLIHYFGFVDKCAAEISRFAKRNNITVIEDAAHALFSELIGSACGKTGDYTIYALHKLLPIQGGMLAANNGNPMPVNLFSVKYEPYQYDYNSISIVRRKNYEAIGAILREHPNKLVIPLHKELPESVVPQTFPIVLPFSDRDAIYQTMNDRGWGVVSLYHTLISELTKESFPSEYTLSRHIMNLPVHQDADARLYADMIADLYEAAEINRI